MPDSLLPLISTREALIFKIKAMFKVKHHAQPIDVLSLSV